MNKEILISATDLKKYFPVHKFMGGKQYVKAVDGVSLEINKGETFGLVGESGCGKSTLERTLIRMYDITDGKVTYKGKDITNEKAKNLQWMKDEVQIIFQDPYSALNPFWNVREIINEPLKKAGMEEKEAEERIEYLLNKVGMSKADMDKFPYEFSGGQRQRIGIARALSVNPEFIVCDEPIAALDVSIQAQVVNMLEDLQNEFGLTYLFAAHDLSMVRYIGTRIGVMYLGTLVEVAESNELYTNPMHPYTKALLSAIPIVDPLKAREHKRIQLKGELPSPMNIPEGCRFVTRCPYATEACKNGVPKLQEISKGHSVACHRAKEIL
ncbi:ABC transporter ATP-binding protein [Coprococcus sp. RTP21204st1_G4_RTP21204_210225]|uniref:ABC transporter ATP-binding protein n=1 Tax=Coprococcus sp. RTP21204st1_G4_RTP21204_210225 TaxID=3143207 RepID=UPI0034A2391D